MRRVSEARARASEPRYISPSPKPTASGLPRRAPLMRSWRPAKLPAAVQALHRRRHRLLRRLLLLQIAGQQMDDDLGVGLRLELVAEGGELAPQLLEVLDDAVVDDGDTVGGVRMRVGLVRPAVRRPARVADAGGARQRLARQQRLQIAELALGAPPGDVALGQRRRTRRRR